jgi:lysophospholipase L1-like esterase
VKISATDPRLVLRGALRTAIVDGWLRVDRPTHDEGGLSADAPGASLELLTDASTLTVHLRRDGRHTRRDAVNGTILITADGTALATGGVPGEGPAEHHWAVSLPDGGRLRGLRFHFPYAESVDSGGFTVNDGARVLAATPEPVRPRWLACGDSITQGFQASSPLCTYPALVGARRGWNVLNAGIGGRRAEAGDGEALATIPADLVTVLLGYNDYYQQRSPAETRDQLAAMIRSLRRGGQPRRPIVVITPLWSSQDAPRHQGHGLDAYRVAVADAVAAVADPAVRLLDGLSLLPAWPDLFTDGIHPNDAGFRLLADNLARVLPDPSIIV